VKQQAQSRKIYREFFLDWPVFSLDRLFSDNAVDMSYFVPVMGEKRKRLTARDVVPRRITQARAC
jgi:hypothetical protein